MGHIEAPPKPTSPTVLDLFIEDARDWCRGRMWIPRALLLLVLVYIFVLKFRDPTRWTIFYGIGDAKLEAFGDTLVTQIREHCATAPS